MIKQVTQQLITLDASIENLQERRYWLQCERAYTYQPIYQTNGRLMAVELLTVVRAILIIHPNVLRQTAILPK